MKQLKVLVYQGIPGSGKSTDARNFVKGKNNWIIVSRDSIRDSLGDYWVPSREDLVSEIEEHSILRGLEKGFNVIIDATNLNEKTLSKWERLVKEFNGDDNFVTIEKKFFDISLDEAIKRDAKRERSVGERVIRDFYNKYIKKNRGEIKDETTRFYRQQDITLPEVISFDIDGTIALMNRSPYNYSKVSEDVPNIPVINFLKGYLKGNKVKVVFVSGRPESCREDSEKWIRNNIPELSSTTWQLFMRKNNDNRKDTLVKQEIFNNDIFPYYNVSFHVDDRSQVVEALRELGILVLQVIKGDF